MHWADRVGQRLKLRDLHILLAVVRRGSMANAASDLAISQPAVSKAIADMEHALGVRLFDRTRNGVEPTIYGRALVRRGSAVFDELKLGVEELAFLANPGVGELLIGSTESIAAGLLPAVMDRFSREHPRVHLTVRQAVINTQHYRELRERSIDLFLGRIPSTFAEDDLEIEIVYDDPVVVVAGARSKWARARRLDLTALAREQWVLPPADTIAGPLARDLFSASGTEMPHAPVTTLSIHVCCRLAATGRFITTLPSSILRFGGDDKTLKVLPIKLPKQARPVGVVTLKNRTLSPVAMRFIDAIRKTVSVDQLVE
jgi:DNA-binding transcriptional LysR family regulator